MAATVLSWAIVGLHSSTTGLLWIAMTILWHCHRVAMALPWASMGLRGPAISMIVPRYDSQRSAIGMPLGTRCHESFHGIACIVLHDSRYHRENPW